MEEGRGKGGNPSGSLKKPQRIPARLPERISGCHAPQIQSDENHNQIRNPVKLLPCSFHFLFLFPSCFVLFCFGFHSGESSGTEASEESTQESSEESVRPRPNDSTGRSNGNCISHSAGSFNPIQKRSPDNPSPSPKNPQRIPRESPENLQRIPQDDAPIGSKPSSGERERERKGEESEDVRGCQRMSEDARRCLRVRADPRTQSKSQRCNRDGTSGFDTQRRHRNRSELNANSTNRCHRLFLSPTSCLLPPLPTHLGSTIQTRLQSHNNNNNNNDSINHNNILK